MIYAIIENEICINIIESDMEFAQSVGAIELSEGYGVGDSYIDGVWNKKEIDTIPNQQLREQAYETLLFTESNDPLISWDGDPITVDMANDLWLKYAAEGSAEADTLQNLIKTAKEYIRGLYPDDTI